MATDHGTLVRVVSGGQTGADQGALQAAREAGLITGGYVPRGCMTLDGPRPDLIMLYGMEELLGKYGGVNYAQRTRANVELGDATLRIATDFTSRGEQRTLKAVKRLARPYLDVDRYRPHDASTVAAWIRTIGVVTLNVAGNSEQTSKGIQEFTYGYMLGVFRRLRELSNNA